MQLNDKTRATFRASWKRYAARDVAVTVYGPGNITIAYTDGCDGQPRGSRAPSLARVEVLAMQWVTWTLVHPGGVRVERKGWLHEDYDAVSSVARDAAELAARQQAANDHPRARENTWSVYETSLDYARRFGDAPMTEPAFARPTAAEIEAAPL